MLAKVEVTVKDNTQRKNRLNIFIVIARELFALVRDIAVGERSSLDQHTVTFINISIGDLPFLDFRRVTAPR